MRVVFLLVECSAVSASLPTVDTTQPGVYERHDR